MSTTLDYEPRRQKPRPNLWIVAWIFAGIFVGLNSQFPVLPWLSSPWTVAVVGLSYLLSPQLKLRLMTILMMVVALSTAAGDASQADRSARAWQIKYRWAEHEMKLLQNQLSTRPTTGPAGKAP